MLADGDDFTGTIGASDDPGGEGEAILALGDDQVTILQLSAGLSASRSWGGWGRKSLTLRDAARTVTPASATKHGDTWWEAERTLNQDLPIA